MNKTLYNLGIFFWGLTIACGLFQTVMQLRIGMQFYMQSSFVAWFLVGNAITLTGGIILLKYYHSRGYWAAFYTLMASTIANVCFAAVLFIILTTRALLSYYMPMVLISLGIGIVSALSLLFSSTRKRFWLRIAGAYLLVISLVLVTTVVWTLLSKDVQLNAVLAKIGLWTSIPASLIYIPFILHFLSEAKLLNSENSRPIKQSLKVSLGIVRALVLIMVLVLGVRLTSESNASQYWADVNFEKTQVMAQLFESRTYVNSKGDTLFYHLLKPSNFDPAKKYPLVVSLPYGGQPGTDKIRQMEGAVAAEVLSGGSYRINYPAFIFVPNCPPGSGWGGIPNYPSVDSLVYEAITSLDKEPGIDVKRRYVTGLSRGGYGTWHFICTRPDLFAAAIPVAGGEDPKLASRIVNIPVWAFHGALDKNVPVSGSRDMINAIKKAGGHPKYTEFPNEGHNIWYQVSITPGLWDWLFAQKRN